ncbi:MAG: Transcription elongation factor, GreA/GreB, C-term [Actinomycetota bacterium]|jgi:transcription elongation GreA/GreB family factor
MSTYLADDPRSAAKVAPALTTVGRAALEQRIQRLREDVLDPLRPHLIGPERDERDVAEFERALAEIERLEAVIAASVELPAPPTGKRAKVSPGALVEIRDAAGDKVKVRPVHPEEATIDDERISWDSPLGKALMGAAVGATLTVPSPRGSWTCEVLRIGR